MKYGLDIKPEGALDFLSLGALVHRLDPGIIPFRKATECRIHVSGGEFNCAANLSDCFRMNTGVATAMVDYPIGELIAALVAAGKLTAAQAKDVTKAVIKRENEASTGMGKGVAVPHRAVSHLVINTDYVKLKPGDVIAQASNASFDAATFEVWGASTRNMNFAFTLSTSTR